jgi:hypothetical protein
MQNTKQRGGDSLIGLLLIKHLELGLLRRHIGLGNAECGLSRLQGKPVDIALLRSDPAFRRVWQSAIDRADFNPNSPDGRCGTTSLRAPCVRRFFVRAARPFLRPGLLAALEVPNS